MHLLKKNYYEDFFFQFLWNLYLKKTALFTSHIELDRTDFYRFIECGPIYLNLGRKTNSVRLDHIVVAAASLTMHRKCWTGEANSTLRQIEYHLTIFSFCQCVCVCVFFCVCGDAVIIYNIINDIYEIYPTQVILVFCSYIYDRINR